MSPVRRVLNILAGAIIGGAFSAFFMSHSEDADTLVKGVFIGIGVLTGAFLSTLRTFLR